MKQLNQRRKELMAELEEKKRELQAEEESIIQLEQSKFFIYIYIN